jgi:hypothetical protein
MPFTGPLKMTGHSQGAKQPRSKLLFVFNR